MRSDHAWLFLKRCDRGCIANCNAAYDNGRERWAKKERRLYSREDVAIAGSSIVRSLFPSAVCLNKVPRHRCRGERHIAGREQCSEQSLSLRIECRRRETSKGVGAADFAHNEKSIAAHVHDQQHPVTMQKDGCAAEQVDAAEAILHVSEECQPRGAVGSGVAWSVVLREHAAHNVFGNVDAEGMSDLLGDAHTAEPGVAA